MVWINQLNKINKDDNLSSSRTDINTVAADGKRREHVMLPVEKLSGWLFMVNPNKVKPKTRTALYKYREEAFAVVDAWFRKGHRNVDSAMRDDVEATIARYKEVAAEATDSPSSNNPRFHTTPPRIKILKPRHPQRATGAARFLLAKTFLAENNRAGFAVLVHGDQFASFMRVEDIPFSVDQGAVNFRDVDCRFSAKFQFHCDKSFRLGLAKHIDYTSFKWLKSTSYSSLSMAFFSLWSEKPWPYFSPSVTGA